MVYPNPASNSIFIKSDNNSQMEISLFDLSGRSILNTRSDPMNIMEINTVGINFGLYLMKIADANGNVLKTQKIAIEK